ncbi:hypothetical protein AB2Z78_005787, partial [Salmonella enterica]
MKKWNKTAAYIALATVQPWFAYGADYKINEGTEQTINGGTELSHLFISGGTAGATTTLNYAGAPVRHSTIQLGEPSRVVRDTPYATHVKSDVEIATLDIESDEDRRTAHKQPNKVRISASIQTINNDSDSTITLDKGRKVEVIRSMGSNLMNVVNNGETGLIDNAYYITNNGRMRNFQLADDVTNNPSGIIRPTNISTTKSMLNEGKIYLDDYDIIIIGKDGESFANDVTGEVHITGDGRLVINTAGRTGAGNWGKIDLERDDGFGPIILRNPEGTTGNISLFNAGTITSPKNAITIDGTRTGEGTVATLLNEGNINGGIITTALNGDKATVKLDNKGRGVWSGDFQDKEYKGRATTNKFVLINNDGTIKTKGNEKNERGIIHSVLTINGGTIDIRDGSLTLDGDYEGRTGGQIHTSGVLGGDETELPNLQITG